MDYARGIAGPVTAHPKIDPVTGELIFFGYNATGPFSKGMTYGAIAASGVVNRFERFEAPYSSMVHDFIVTENYVLFPILPLTGSMDRAMSGRPAYAWEPDKGAYVGVMKRGGSAKDIRWFRGEACYVFHTMNAWEEGDLIVADVMQREAPALFPAADGKPIAPEKQIARLARWTFNMADGSDSFTRVYLDDLQARVPAHRRPPRRARQRAQLVCRGHRAGQPEARSTASPMSTTRPACASSTSCRAAMPRPSRCSCRARPMQPKATAGCWQRCGARRRTAAISRCSDATEVDRGPVATVELATRVPFGLHGNWVPAAA